MSTQPTTTEEPTMNDHDDTMDEAEDNDPGCCVRCANPDKADLFDSLKIGHNDHTPAAADATEWDD